MSTCFEISTVLFVYYRYKNGTVLAAKENHAYSHENGVHSLKITKPKVADIGAYSCEGSGKAAVDLRVASKSL